MRAAYIDRRYFAYNVTANSAKDVADKLEAIIEAAYRMERLLYEL